MSKLAVITQILFLYNISLQTPQVLETIIEEDILFDMLQSCLIAFPSSLDSQKREICLLQISNLNSPIKKHNKSQKKNTDKFFYLEIHNNCMELENGANYNGGRPKNLACDFLNDYLPQKWIFEIEGEFFKVKNGKFNKCLSLPVLAVDGDFLIVEDCVANKLEQRFTSDQNHRIRILHFSGKCLKYDINSGSGFFEAYTCSTGLNYGFYIIFKDVLIFNPFFKKCLEIGTQPEIKNCNKNEKQRFEVYLNNPVLNQYIFHISDYFMSLVSIPGNDKLLQDYSYSLPSHFELQWVKPKFFKLKSNNTSQCITINKFLIEEGNSVYMNDSCIMKDTNLWQFIQF